MSEQGYDKVFSAMHGEVKEQPKIGLPSYEALFSAAYDVALMHVHPDRLRGGFYCGVCLQRAPREFQIKHLATCTAGRILTWATNTGWDDHESEQDKRLRENAKTLLAEARHVIQVFDDGDHDIYNARESLNDLETVVAKIVNGD